MERLPYYITETVEVKMNDWAFAPSGEEKILKTAGVFPCIALVITSQQGTYLGHFSDVQGHIQRGSLEPEIKTIDQMLLDVGARVDDENSQVWVSGASPASDEIRYNDDNPTAWAELAFDNFGYTLNLLKKHGFKEENIEECMSGYDEILNLEVNSRSGKMSVEIKALAPDSSFTNDQRYWDFKNSKKY